MFSRVIKILIGFVFTLLIALTLIITLIDPNDYREELEQQALNTAGINLSLEGDISWSFWPLGFSIEDLEIYDQNGQLFTRLASTKLDIDTASLFSLSPVVNGIYSSGATIRLLVDERGQANWSNLLLEASVGAAPEPSSNTSKPATNHKDISPSQKASSGVVAVLADHLHFQDYTVEYINKAEQKHFLLEGLSIDVRDASLDTNFPVAISFKINDKLSALRYAHELNTHAYISSDFDTFTLTNLENNIDIAGLLTEHPLKFSLTGALSYSKNDNKLSAQEIQLSGAGLAVDTQFEIVHVTDSPHVRGSLSIAPFALSAVNKHLGLDLGVNKRAFNAVSLATPFSFSDGWLKLTSFDLNIDQSKFIGNIKASPANSDYDITLHGNGIKIDKYLAAIEPSKTDTQNTPPKGAHRIAAIDSTQSNTEENALIPLSTVNDLRIRADIKLDSVEYNAHKLGALMVGIEAIDGLIDLHTLSFNTLNGAIDGKLKVDARRTPVTWKTSGNIKEIDLELLAVKQGLNAAGFVPSGLFNASYKLQAQGNTVKDLLTHNDGTARTYIRQGTIRGIDADGMLCQGYALSNGEHYTQELAEVTAFKAFTAKHVLADGALDSTDIEVKTDTLTVNGSGLFNLVGQHYDYGIKISPLNNTNERSCRVNPKLLALSIPLICEGSVINQEHQCAIDKTTLLKQARRLLKAEAKRKANKEVDRALDKQLNKLDRYIDKDSEAAQNIKKGLLKLFQ